MFEEVFWDVFVIVGVLVFICYLVVVYDVYLWWFIILYLDLFVVLGCNNIEWVIGKKLGNFLSEKWLYSL